MKRITSAIALVLLFSVSACSQINWKKTTKSIQDAAKGSSLSNDDIVKGLKEALSIGSNQAGDLASKVDGYYKNPALFIPFPPEAKKVETKMRELGMGKTVDQFTLSLNRAAELAAKEAAPIFLDAIRSLTITDGMNILKGNTDAATQYLRNKTTASLTEKFRPIITKALSQVNATKYWTDLSSAYNMIPRVKKVNTDLAGYTTDLAIQGLFKLVADEEAKIRKDPAARVSDILKKVFGAA